MTCTDCVSFYRDKIKTDNNLQKGNTFILGCTKFRTTSVNDHETSKSHEKAHDFIVGKQKSDEENINSKGGRALDKLNKSAERSRLLHLFGNAHAIAKKKCFNLFLFHLLRSDRFSVGLTDFCVLSDPMSDTFL